MIQGSCLCGAVQWRFGGVPEGATAEQIASAQANLGSAVTITGTLKLINGAYITSHPTYGSDAILELAQNFSANGNYYLWPSGTGSNVPSNIYISSGTVTMSQINLYVKKEYPGCRWRNI